MGMRKEATLTAKFKGPAANLFFHPEPPQSLRDAHVSSSPTSVVCVNRSYREFQWSASSLILDPSVTGGEGGKDGGRDGDCNGRGVGDDEWGNRTFGGVQAEESVAAPPVASSVMLQPPLGRVSLVAGASFRARGGGRSAWREPATFP